MNIILLTEQDKTTENVYVVKDNRAEHINKILKSQKGDIVEIGILNGKTGTAKITEITDKKVKLKLLNIKETKTLEPIVDIICALPRPQTLKKVLNTIATMGVNNLYLIRSAKVEKSFYQSTLLKNENYTKYLLEGLSQGKRTKPPEVSIHKKFKLFFENNFTKENENKTKLLADTGTDKFLNKLKIENKKHYIIAIGPEGGWTDYEIAFMKKYGFITFKLSQNILRVETAVTAALAQLELINS